MKVHKLLAILLLNISLFACSALNKGQTEKSKDYKFEQIANGQHSGIRDRTFIVARNSIDNNVHQADFIIDNKLNTVDYSKRMLIEIYIGERPSSGYNINIDKIIETSNNIEVHYSVESPDGIVATVMTSPYLIIEGKKSEKTVLFFENGTQIE